MTPHDKWVLVSGCCMWLRNAYIWSYSLKQFPLPQRLRDAARRVKREVRPFYMPSIVVGLTADFFSLGRDVLDPLLLTGYGVMAVVYWVISRADDDDDDQWKRRRDRVAGAVRELGGKLVVVPEPAGA